MAAKKAGSQQPLRIPLTFEDALDGLMAIDPKKLPKSARPGTKKRAGKKPDKKKTALGG